MEEQCLVSVETLREAKRLSQAKKYVEAASLLLQKSVSFEIASEATNSRDATRLLTAIMHELRMSTEACLSVSVRANPSEVKKAYRRAVRSCHPDKTNGDTGELFAIITAAYEELLEKAEARSLEMRKEENSVVEKEEDVEQENDSDSDRYEIQLSTAAAAQEAVDVDPLWEKMFWEMTGYKLEHGHCYAQRGTLIGNWGIQQRLANEQDKLSEHRRARLESIGFHIDNLDWRFHFTKGRASSNSNKKKKKKRSSKRTNRRKRNNDNTDPDITPSWIDMFCATTAADDTTDDPPHENTENPPDEKEDNPDDDLHAQVHCGTIFYEQTQVDKENFHHHLEQPVPLTKAPNSSSSFLNAVLTQVIGGGASDASFSVAASVAEQKGCEADDIEIQRVTSP